MKKKTNKRRQPHMSMNMKRGQTKIQTCTDTHIGTRMKRKRDKQNLH